MKIHKKTPQRKLISWLFFLPIILGIVGLFFVFEASSIRSYNEYGDSFHYVKLQIVWVTMGIAIMTFFSFFDYNKLYYLSVFMMITTIFLLVIVLIPHIGHSAGGARRWIDLGFFSLQPSEFAKLATIIYLSSWFSIKERKRFLSFLVLLGALMFLIILQPDMGTASIIFSVSIIIYFLAGVDLHYLYMFLPLSIIGFIGLVKFEPYRFNRFLAFFDPASDPTGQGIRYHINQILISLSNGGLIGQGFGASRQKYMFLPEAHTDSIFAIIGEEYGFVGGVMLIIAFIILLYLLLKANNNASNRFGQLLAGGIFAFFGLQITTNLFAMVNLMPLTGVPLPFISYGGSNILISFALIGIAINISKQSKHI